jgi:hypothetical protein
MSVDNGGVTSIEMVPYPGSGPGTCRSGIRKYILNVRSGFEGGKPFPF